MKHGQWVRNTEANWWQHICGCGGKIHKQETNDQVSDEIQNIDS